MADAPRVVCAICLGEIVIRSEKSLNQSLSRIARALRTLHWALLTATGRGAGDTEGRPRQRGKREKGGEAVLLRRRNNWNFCLPTGTIVQGRSSEGGGRRWGESVKAPGGDKFSPLG